MDDKAKPSPILLAHNERVARETLARDLTNQGYSVRASASFDTLWNWIRAGEGDLVLIDVDIADPARNGFELLKQIRQTYPSLPVLVLSAENTVLTSLLAARFGASDYFPKPFSFEQLHASIKQALRETQSKQQHPKAHPNLPLIGSSAAMQGVYRRIAQAAQSNLPLLVTGETGTGKNLVAKVIHDYGNYSSAEFTVLHFPQSDEEFNARIAKSVALTGVGTLVLDEISTLSPYQHDRLISLLSGLVDQEHALRLITTTRKPYSEASGVQGISHELMYRLNTLHIDLPPLRDRQGDCIELAQAFLAEFGKGRKTLSRNAEQSLSGRAWPGNVRELRNMLQRAILMARSGRIGRENFEDFPQGNTATEPGLDAAFEQALLVFFDDGESSTMPVKLYLHVLAALERPFLKRVMAMTDGNQLKAATRLGINRNTLRKKLVQYGLHSQK